jgi:hypothetical protein
MSKIDVRGQMRDDVDVDAGIDVRGLNSEVLSAATKLCFKLY